MSIQTPWGQSQSITVFAPGFLRVETAGHGGLMLTERFAQSHLSPEALAEGSWYGQGASRYLCYEEDCQCQVAEWELLDEFGDKLFAPCGPEDAWRTQERRRAELYRLLSNWHAEYLIARGIEPLPEGLAFYRRFQEIVETQNRDRPPMPDWSDVIVRVWGDGYEECRPGEVIVETADGAMHFVTADSCSYPYPDLLSLCTLSRT